MPKPRDRSSQATKLYLQLVVPAPCVLWPKRLFLCIVTWSQAASLAGDWNVCHLESSSFKWHQVHCLFVLTRAAMKCHTMTVVKKSAIIQLSEHHWLRFTLEDGDLVHVLTALLSICNDLVKTQTDQVAHKFAAMHWRAFLATCVRSPISWQIHYFGLLIIQTFRRSL